MQLKARSVKRAKKKGIRGLEKRGKRAFEDDSNDGYGFLPTPAELNSSLARKEGGRDGTKFKRKMKNKSTPSVEGQTSIAWKDFEESSTKKTSIQLPFNKNFWTGPSGEDPPSEALKLLRKTIGVVVRGPSAHSPPPISTFDDISLPVAFNSIMRDLKCKTPSTVQKQCWPIIMTGANVLVIAPTGSGKTLTYGLPMIPHIQDQLQQAQIKESTTTTNTTTTPTTSTNNRTLYPIGLVIVPTRELAIQVTSVLKSMKKSNSIFPGTSFIIFPYIPLYSVPNTHILTLFCLKTPLICLLSHLYPSQIYPFSSTFSLIFLYLNHKIIHTPSSHTFIHLHTPSYTFIHPHIHPHIHLYTPSIHPSQRPFMEDRIKTNNLTHCFVPMEHIRMYSCAHLEDY